MHDPFDERAVAPHPLRSLTRAARQELLNALVAILPERRDEWAHALRSLHADDGDAAPLLVALVRRADAAQARAHRGVFLRAFGAGP